MDYYFKSKNSFIESFDGTVISSEINYSYDYGNSRIDKEYFIKVKINNEL